MGCDAVRCDAMRCDVMRWEGKVYDEMVRGWDQVNDGMGQDCLMFRIRLADCYPDCTGSESGICGICVCTCRGICG